MSAPLETAAPSATRPAVAPRLPLGGLLAASCTVLCWASAFVAMRVALRSFAPQEVALLRFVAAAAALGALALVKRMPLPALRDVPRFAVLGLVGHALYNLALAQGQAHVPAATAGFIIASAPIWMVLMGATMGQERPTAAGVGGMLVSLAGVGLISAARGAALVLDASALILLAAAVMQAAYSMGQRPLLRRYSALQVSTLSVWMALAWLAPFAPRALVHAAHAPWQHTAAAAFMGIVPTAIGYSTWSAAMRRLSPSVAGSFLYLVPAVVVALAWALLDEVPSAMSLAGGGLVVAGVVLVQRLGQRARPGRAP